MERNKLQGIQPELKGSLQQQQQHLAQMDHSQSSLLRGNLPDQQNKHYQGQGYQKQQFTSENSKGNIGNLLGSIDEESD